MDQHAAGTVFIIDDDVDVREMIKHIVSTIGLQVETFSSADEFLKLHVAAGPGCIVTDVRLPGMSGLELQEALAQRNSAMPVIVVSGHTDVPMAVRAMRSHALDVLQKPFNKQELLDRIQQALRMDAERQRQRGSSEAVAARVATLTPREREIMDLIVQGLANKQMAYQLGLSEKTIETHRSRVMRKMSVESVAELVRAVLMLNADERRGG